MHFYLHVLEVCIIVLVSAHCLCRLPCGVELVIISYLISLKLVLNYCLDHPIFFGLLHYYRPVHDAFVCTFLSYPKV